MAKTTSVMRRERKRVRGEREEGSEREERSGEEISLSPFRARVREEEKERGKRREISFSSPSRARA